MAKPGFAGSCGREQRARGEARHQQNEAGGQNGTENFIEFEGVHFRIRLQAGNVDLRPERNGRGCIRNQAFAPHPEPRSDIGLPVLWQPV